MTQGSRKNILMFKDENAIYSNFYHVIIQYEGIVYPTVEHAYQAAKSKDAMYRRRIAALGPLQAGKAKRMGNKVKLREDWEIIKVSVMRNLLVIKFDYEEFKVPLLASGDCMIVEGNYWHDNYWGDCHCGRNECSIIGKNMLGKLLMKLRSQLR